jgi:hypothetical protein
VGLVTFGAELERQLPAQSRRDHFWRLIGELDASEWLEDTQAPEALMSLPSRLPPKGVIFLISDGFDFRAHAEEEDVDQAERAESRFIDVARAWRKHGYHVVFLHVLDPHELTFPFDELSLFEGLEGEAPLKIDPDGVRNAYLEEVRAFCEGLERGARASGARYALCRSDLPLDQTLLQILECLS